MQVVSVLFIIRYDQMHMTLKVERVDLFFEKKIDLKKTLFVFWTKSVTDF